MNCVNSLHGDTQSELCSITKGASELTASHRGRLINARWRNLYRPFSSIPFFCRWRRTSAWPSSPKQGVERLKQTQVSCISEMGELKLSPQTLLSCILIRITAEGLFHLACRGYITYNPTSCEYEASLLALMTCGGGSSLCTAQPRSNAEQNHRCHSSSPLLLFLKKVTFSFFLFQNIGTSSFFCHLVQEQDGKTEIPYRDVSKSQSTLLPMQSFLPWATREKTYIQETGKRQSCQKCGALDLTSHLQLED